MELRTELIIVTRPSRDIFLLPQEETLNFILINIGPYEEHLKRLMSTWIPKKVNRETVMSQDMKA